MTIAERFDILYLNIDPFTLRHSKRFVCGSLLPPAGSNRLFLLKQQRSVLLSSYYCHIIWYKYVTIHSCCVKRHCNRSRCWYALNINSCHYISNKIHMHMQLQTFFPRHIIERCEMSNICSLHIHSMEGTTQSFTSLQKNCATLHVADIIL